MIKYSFKFNFKVDLTGNLMTSQHLQFQLCHVWIFWRVGEVEKLIIIFKSVVFFIRVTQITVKFILFVSYSFIYIYI